MLNFLTSTVDGFLPESFRGDPHAERRGRVLVGAAWASALGCALALASRLALGQLPAGPLVVAVLVTLLLAAAPFVLRATGRARLAGGLVAYGFTAALFGFITFTGGLDQPVVVMLPFMPLLTSFLVDRRSGVVIALLVTVFALFLFVPGRACPPTKRSRRSSNRANVAAFSWPRTIRSTSRHSNAPVSVTGLAVESSGRSSARSCGTKRKTARRKTAKRGEASLFMKSISVVSNDA